MFWVSLVFLQLLLLSEIGYQRFKHKDRKIQNKTGPLRSLIPNKDSLQRVTIIEYIFVDRLEAVVNVYHSA